MPHAHVSVQLLRPVGEGTHEPVLGRERLRAHSSSAAPVAGRRSMPQMLDLALEVLRDRFALLAGLSALCWLPVRALQPFLAPHIRQMGGLGGVNFGAFGFAALVSNAGAVLAQTFAAAVLAQIVVAHLEGREASVGQSLRGALGRAPAIVTLAIVVTVMTTAGLCACILPYYLLSWKLSCAPTVCIVEDRSVGDSVRRSFVLTRHGFWRWLALTLSVGAMALPFTGISALADLPVLRADVLRWCGLSSGTYDALLVLVSSLLLGVASALHASAMTVFYADCRVRREGVDLEHSLEQIVRAAAAGESRA